jgi:hypothetical protein
VQSEFGVPVGIVEVKKPSTKDGMKREKIAPQLYDYLIRLKSFYGLRYVFGIATTYTEWQIYWLEDSDDMARSTTITPGESRPKVELAQQCETEDNDKPINAKIDDNDTLLPVVYVAPPIRFDDPALTSTILSVITKMYNSPFDTVLELSNNLPYIILQRDTWYWRKVNWGTDPVLNRHKMPAKSCKSYILLQDMRGGEDGRVWVACSTKGLVCVLKFGAIDAAAAMSAELLSAAMEQARAKLEHEQLNYIRQADDIVSHVITLGGRPVLMMRHYTPVDFSNANSRKEVIHSVKELAAKRKLFHKDLKQEHIVWDTPAKKIRFIDMAQVDQIDNTQISRATNSMPDALKLLEEAKVLGEISENSQ